MEREKKNPFVSAAMNICPRIRAALLRVPECVMEGTQEIRLRMGEPVCVCCYDALYDLEEKGVSLQRASMHPVLANRADIADTIALMCAYSVHSHQNEINDGYLSLRGGHRAGLCGTAVVTKGEITGVRDINAINLRVGRPLIGCADALMDRLSHRVERGFLLAGAPSSGKTTLLRDTIRTLSLSGRRVAVVDERGEIGAAYQGERFHALGPNCDLMTGYPKNLGVLHAIRSLSPEFIVCDELGGKDDLLAIEQGLHSGVTFVATVHAGQKRELMQKRQIQALLHTGAFETVVLLESRRTPGKIQDIYKVGELLDADNRHTFSGDGRNRNGIHPVQSNRPTG